MEESVVENEPMWMIEDDSSMRYPEYVALLLLTGLRFGISCEKVHQLFQISGTWRLECRENGMEEKKVSTSLGSKETEAKKESDGSTDEDWLLRTTLFPVCDSFEGISEASRYCVHLQRESASSWTESPSSLPSFHYCRKVEATQEEGNDSGSPVNNGNFHSSRLRKESSIMTLPLDCLYCFNKQLFRVENDARSAGEYVKPAVVVDTLATEALSETESVKCAGASTSSIPPLSSSLLRHYHVHQKRCEKLIAKLNDDDENMQTNDGLPVERLHEIEAAAEEEARHCTFVCVAGTSVLPVVVTYCAACEMFGPLTSFRYDPPFLSPELEVGADNVGINGEEFPIKHSLRQEVSSSPLQVSSFWITSDPSLMIVARLLVALHVMENALPDLLKGIRSESSTSSRISCLHPFLPDLSPQEGSSVVVHDTSLKETIVAKEIRKKSCQAAKREERISFPTKIPSHGSPRSLEDGASDESFDLRSYSTESKSSDKGRATEVEISSKFLFLPTPLVFQDPPPTLPTSIFSEEEVVDQEGEQDGSCTANGEPRQYLTDTFEKYMEEMVSVDAVLPGACWVLTKTSEPSELRKKEENTEEGKTTVSDEKEKYGSALHPESAAVQTTDLSSLSTSDTNGEEGDFLLYVCSRPDLSRMTGGIMDVVPVDDGAWLNDKEVEKIVKRRDGTSLEESVKVRKEIATPLRTPVALPSCSSCTLVVHDVLVGLLVAFPSPEVLARCIQESLIPRIRQELNEKEAIALPPFSSFCHRYYPLPYRLTHREVYLPEKERWVKAVVLYHDDYSYPFRTKNVHANEGTATGSSSVCKERWLGEDANGFRRASATYSLFVPHVHSHPECPTQNTLFPSFFLSPQGSSESYVSVEKSEEEEDDDFFSPSSTCVSLIDNSQLLLTRNHPFSLEARRLKVLIGAALLAKALQEVLHTTPTTRTF